MPAIPVPLKETICGLPLALSATERVPFKVPVLPGVKVTLTVQLAPDATMEPQLSVSPKLAVAEMPKMFSVAAP